ncbi:MULTISPECIES: hypothetical protein [unclassified Rhodococcus (in: high G+C Gram-positive bacteria)]|uniref:hypothetical protein n=1 Tax=Rhodococcus sp. SJ-3 TaxID=3454628 RepID=UPI003F796837
MHELDTVALIQAGESGAPVQDVREDYENIQGHVPGAQLIFAARGCGRGSR